MDSENTGMITETAEGMAKIHLPRWNELPDLEIYMDQVLSLISRYFADYPGFDSKGITASMVNNYVKLGISPPPVKKKYHRMHLAYLIIICVLKTVLPISLVSGMIAGKIESGCSYEELYNMFCDLFESSVSSAAASFKESPGSVSSTDAAFRAALNAHAEQTLAMGLMRAE